MADKNEFTKTYLLWFVGTVIWTVVPVGALLALKVMPMIAGAIGFGVFAGGFSGGMTSAYKLGLKHGASSESK